MKETIDILKKTDVISNENVYGLKRYIIKKYPDLSYKRQTEVFADSVHKILNRNLLPFNKEERDNIKAKVLVNAVNKKEFSVSAYDIFRECLIINNGEKEYCNNMGKWLNRQKDINVDSVKFNSFLETVWLEQGSNIDETISRAAAINNDRKEVSMSDVPSQIALKQESYSDSNKFIGSQSDGDDANKIKTITYNEEFTLFQMFLFVCRSCLFKTKFFILNIFNSFLLDKKYRRRVAICSFTAFILVFLGAYGIKHTIESRQETVSTDNEVISNGDMGIIDGLSDEFKYAQIDKESLRKWLANKNSMLSEDKYLTPVIEAGKEFGVNPILLIAITGQEQAFVPRDIKNADKIINNPFNVFGSWQEYNTNIDDSARIAAETIVHSSNGRPVNADELQWINKRYAQDPKWWVGVTKIFYQIKKDILAK